MPSWACMKLRLGDTSPYYPVGRNPQHRNISAISGHNKINMLSFYSLDGISLSDSRTIKNRDLKQIYEYFKRVTTCSPRIRLREMALRIPCSAFVEGNPGTRICFDRPRPEEFAPLFHILFWKSCGCQEGWCEVLPARFRIWIPDQDPRFRGEADCQPIQLFLATTSHSYNRASG